MGIRFKKNDKKNIQDKYLNKINRKIKYHYSFYSAKKKLDDIKKYRFSKRIKHKTKSIRVGFIKKLCSKPINLIDLFIKIGLYKQTLLLKLIFVLVPFAIVLLLDNVVVAIIVATINIFFCALFFSITTTERHEAIVDGKFDYGKYKYIKSYKETIAILLMFFVSSALILIGHNVLEDLIPTISGISIK